MHPRILLPLVPVAVAAAVPWVRYREAQALREGIPLGPAEEDFARQLGILQPEAVRLLRVDAVRAFEHPVLRTATFGINHAFRNTAGITLRYGILIRSDFWGHSRLIAHELVHVAQYERLGSIASFLHAYFRECLLEGYPYGPLEQEALIRGRDYSSE